MNPLLVTGLVSVGQRLLDGLSAKLAQPSQVENIPGGETFSRYLNAQQSVSAPSKLNELLEANGVRTPQELDSLQFNQRQQFLNHADLAQFVSSADRSQGFQLSLHKGEMYTLTDSTGKQFSFSAHSELGQLAGQLQQLERMDEISSAFPGYALKDLAHKVETNPVDEGKWFVKGLG